MDVENSSKHFKKMYDKLSYFDQYGNSVFLFIFLTTIVFLVYSYCSVQINIHPIKEDWLNQRCKPNVIPFAGFINKPLDKTITEFTQENFNFCLQNMLVPVTANAVNPVNYIVSSFQEIANEVSASINHIRSMFNSIRGDFLNVGEDVLGRLINFLIPIQQIIVTMRDLFAKITGVAVSALYTSLGTYFTLKSLLGSVVSITIQLLLILVALLVLSFVFLPWLYPVTIALTSLYVSVAIPLAIIVVFLSETLGISANAAIPSMPSPPSLSSCFDKNTMILLKNNREKPISDIKPGDILLDGEKVTGIMKLDATDIQMYHLFGIIVSSTHYVKYLNSWIRVESHPDAVRIYNYDDPYIYCFSTTTKSIPIFSNVIGDSLYFMDWDDVCQILEETKERKDAGPEEIHIYFDSGLESTTEIVLQNKRIINICNVQVGDILEHGEQVYGLVEIEAKNIYEYTKYSKKNRASADTNSYFLTGTNIYFCDCKDNLEEFEKVTSLEKREDTLFHLLTHKSSFHVAGVKIHDYNSAINYFLEKKYYL